MSRSLNRVTLIGNLTDNIELRKTPQGTSVCTFSVATNRSWQQEDGTKKEETEFHRVVAWNKLADLCNQLLHKGSKVYIDGRLQTRQYDKDDEKRSVTEIILNDMLVLESKVKGGE